MQSVLDRLDKFTQKTDTCWLWTSAKNEHGYGLISYQGKTTKAHRLAYALFVGPIPDGMFVLHKCDTPACVRPSHLFLGDSSANVQDMVTKGRHTAQQRTHCPHGHPYDDDNTIITTKGWRKCRTCHLESNRKP